MVLIITFDKSDAASHGPPASEYVPSPILAKIVEGGSSGPTANGVSLHVKQYHYHYLLSLSLPFRIVV